MKEGFPEEIKYPAEENGGEEKRKEHAMTRRDFLRVAAGALAGTAAGVTAEFGATDAEAAEKKKDNLPPMKYLNLFDYRSDAGELDEGIMNGLKKYWKSRFKDPEDVAHGILAESILRMKPVDGMLAKVFKKYGVPDGSRYLAIIESKFLPHAVSRAGAVGYYQFMPDTARKYGLKTQSPDERRDPIKSADAAARYLKDLYRETGDWNLAFSRYNGGFAGRYAGEAEDKKEPITYAGFLEYMQKEIQDLKRSLRSEGAFTISHTAKKGDTISGIARKYGKKIPDLIRANGLTNPHRIGIGQEILIPLHTDEEKERYFNRAVRGNRENLEYAQKFNAVFEVIREMKK